MPARSVCLVTLSLSEAGPGRFGCQVSVTDIYHTMPCMHVWSGTQVTRHEQNPLKAQAMKAKKENVLQPWNT